MNNDTGLIAAYIFDANVIDDIESKPVPGRNESGLISIFNCSNVWNNKRGEKF